MTLIFLILAGFIITWQASSARVAKLLHVADLRKSVLRQTYLDGRIVQLNEYLDSAYTTIMQTQNTVKGYRDAFHRSMALNRGYLDEIANLRLLLTQSMIDETFDPATPDANVIDVIDQSDHPISNTDPREPLPGSVYYCDDDLDF